MIIGTASVPGVPEESICRLTQPTMLTEVGDYQFASNAFMAGIPFEESKVIPCEIDSSIFMNAQGTELTFDNFVLTQNFITAKYIGRAPLEYYGEPTEAGREFTMICKDGLPIYTNIFVGSADAIAGFNKDANDNEMVPK